MREKKEREREKKRPFPSIREKEPYELEKRFDAI